MPSGVERLTHHRVGLFVILIGALAYRRNWKASDDLRNRGPGTNYALTDSTQREDLPECSGAADRARG
jgi:hypothetical protein